MSFVMCGLCGAEYDNFGRRPDENYCDNCLAKGQEINEQREIERNEGKKKFDELQEKINQIKLTTTPTYANYEIEEVLDVITSECVFGMNIFRDFFAGVRDVFGGRSSASQKILRDARRTCLFELKKEAFEMGGDAVIGIDLDYSEISGKGKGMLFLVASGTVVKFKK